jgi:hypothetical protein
MAERVDLDDLIKALSDEVRRDPRHRLAPHRRQDIYEEIAQAYKQASVTIFGRVGCLAAKRVLHVFEDFSPGDPAPREILHVAEAILEGEADRQAAVHKLDQGYHASGNSWGYDEAEIPPSAWLAANAAYHSLAEALGRRPLGSLPEYNKGGTALPWADEDLCWLAFADTASVACMAMATASSSAVPDSESLLSFWTWWLTEAIPAAIESAESGHPGDVA